MKRIFVLMWSLPLLHCMPYPCSEKVVYFSDFALITTDIPRSKTPCLTSATQAACEQNFCETYCPKTARPPGTSSAVGRVRLTHCSASAKSPEISCSYEVLYDYCE